VDHSPPPLLLLLLPPPLLITPLRLTFHDAFEKTDESPSREKTANDDLADFVDRQRAASRKLYGLRKDYRSVNGLHCISDCS